MLKLIEKRRNAPALRRCSLTAGQRVSRKYRRANIRRVEYKKLKAIVPAIATKNRVTKVEVIEEAIKYIDELHQALYSRVPHIYGNGLPPFLPDMSPECALAQILRRVTPQSVHSSATSTCSSNTTHQNPSDSSFSNNGQSKELSHHQRHRPLFHQNTSTQCFPPILSGRQAPLGISAPLGVSAPSSTLVSYSHNLLGSHRTHPVQSTTFTNSFPAL